jgi:molecular chaperone DnaK (HSP70)
MILLGYDYGTTNSMVSRYIGGEEDDGVKILCRRSSAIHDGHSFVRSPKRLFSVTPMDEVRAGRYLHDFTLDVFQYLKPLFPQHEKVFLTATVPNAFKDVQCKLMLDTIRNTCREVFSNTQFQNGAISIIPEPVAAALYYVCRHGILDNNGPRLVSVCDIGGGTTDLAIVRYDISGDAGNKVVKFKVICTEGCDMLGGDDIDEIIADDLRNRFSLDEVPHSEEMLILACQALKRILSCKERASVILTDSDRQNTAKYPNGDVIELSLTRHRLNLLLEQRFKPRLDNLLISLKRSFANTMERDMNTAEAILADRSVILPIGGSSQIPYLQGIISEQLKGEVDHLPGETADDEGHAPFDSVVRGAAIYSAWQQGRLDGIRDIVIEDRTLHRISVRVNGDQLETIVEKNMPSDTYRPHRQLFPLFADPGGETFRICRIDLYEGEGAYVGDTSYGSPPVHLESLADILENLNDKVYVHNRELREIDIKIRLTIVQGRLRTLEVRIPKGNSDESDYDKRIEFLT